MWIDFIIQSYLHKIVRIQIAQFEADVYKHFKYIPSDDLLDDTDVHTVLEGERSSDDPKVGTYFIIILIHHHLYIYFYSNEI